MSNSSVCNILDLPDEILVKIILYFNARERLPLGNSCKRFNDLVFGDEVLLRNLDFTREWQLTKESDIRQYFKDENTYKKIIRINAENVWEANSLSSLIGKAVNLVELNILSGIRFHSVEGLSGFLEPLVNLKRLSVNWPATSERTEYDKPEWNKVLEKPLGRLTYLSLEISWYLKDFLLILQLCQQLEELRMLISREAIDSVRPLRQEPMKLANLKRVRLIAGGHSAPLRNDFMSIVPDPTEWTDFYLVDCYHEVYFERNVEVCAELSQVKRMPLPRSIADFRETGLIDKCWPLVPGNLLTEVIRITHDDAPEKFCCLSSFNDHDDQLCLLEIDEAKKLLKDPGYQISYLEFSHAIEKNCDVHLVASAFPNLTRLVLCRISNRNSMSRLAKTEPFQRCLRQKGSLASEEHNDASNTDSSFKMLVENTPQLQVLMISPRRQGNGVKYWDLDALHLISGWKNLTVIHLCDIPIKDGKFLIDIGRDCKKLEKVMLHRLGPDKNCSYESELLEMLQHCKNLRKFSIRQSNLKHVPEMFSKLSSISRLGDLNLETTIKDCDSLKLASSVEKMFRQCQLLNKFSIDISPYPFYVELRLAVERIIGELNRPDFQFNSAGPEFDYDNSSNAFFSSPLVPFPRRG